MRIPVDVSRDGFKLVRVWPDLTADVVPVHLLIYDDTAPVHDALPEVRTPTMDSFRNPIGLLYVGLQMPDGRVIDSYGGEFQTLWHFIAACRKFFGKAVPKATFGAVLPKAAPRIGQRVTH